MDASLSTLKACRCDLVTDLASCILHYSVQTLCVGDLTSYLGITGLAIAASGSKQQLAPCPVCRCCRHLALSTNNIEKISSLSGMDNLRILSLGRNLLKKIENVEVVADTLEELWLSYNQIEKLVSRLTQQR